MWKKKLTPRQEAWGDPLFDVYGQAVRVLADVQLKPTKNGAKYAVEVLENLAITKELQLRFVPKLGKSVLSGLELVRQPSEKSE